MSEYIEDYIIDTSKLLGQGACGKVFVATKRNDTRQFCAKIVTANSQNIQKELEILNFMKDKQNENIVNVFYCNFIQDRGYFVIIMEKCESDLEKEIKFRQQQIQQTGKLYTEQEATEIMRQLFNGYKILYQSQIIHRDIKPANILTAQGKYKLADFGVGKIYSSDSNLLNITKSGTPVFKAPELQGNYEYNQSDLIYIQGNPPRFGTLTNSTIKFQPNPSNIPFQGTFDDKEKKQKLMHKVDIYSFGILFYHLLTNSYPFELSIPGISDFIKKIKDNPFRVPPQFKISPATCSLIEKMITYSPVERIDFPSLVSYFGVRLGTIYNRDAVLSVPLKPANLQRIVMILPQKPLQDWIQAYRNLFVEKCYENNSIVPIYRNYCDLCLNLAIIQFDQFINQDIVKDYIAKYQTANKSDIQFKIEEKVDKLYYISEYCRILQSQFIPKHFNYEQIKTYGESHLKFMFISTKLIKGHYNFQGFLGMPTPNYNGFKELIQQEANFTKEQYKQYLDETF